MKKKTKTLEGNDRLLLIVFLGLTVFLAATTREFLTFGNLMRILQQMSELGIVSLGIMLVILTGGFDMSSSAMIGMTSVTVGVLFKSGMNIWAAVLLGLAAALAAGLFNGWLVGELNIAPMLATLGTMTLYQGIGLALSKGDAISGFPEDFLMLGQGYLAGIPLQLFLLAALVILMTVVMNKGRFGRKVYLIGSGQTGSKFAGINVKKTIILCYGVAALMAGLSGVVVTSRLATARADAGASYMFEGVAAVMLGGTDLAGGSGKVSGTIIGVLIFAILGNGLNLNKISSLKRQMLIGIVLLAVLLIRQFSGKLKERRMISGQNK